MGTGKGSFSLLIRTGLLFLLLVTPLQAQNFNVFLNNFHKLYDVYHFGKHLPKGQLDRIACKIWAGSGQDYYFASVTACQGIYESHYQIKGIPVQYRGHQGMNIKTIIAEGRRTGLIDRKKKNARWLLRECRNDPSLADKLAASRLVYLFSIYGEMNVTIYQWVRGESWKTNESDFKDCRVYYQGVMMLIRENFKGVLNDTTSN